MKNNFIKSKRLVKLIAIPILGFVIPMIVLYFGYAISHDLARPNPWKVGLIARTTLLIIAPFIMLKVFVSNVVKTEIFSKIESGLLTMFYMVFLIVIFLEIGTTFIIKTIPVEYSLSSLNWHLLHDGPTNSYLYRDEEFTKEKDKLAGFYGDSFTEGYGLKNYKDRYSNIVEENSDYETWNYGVQGGDAKSMNAIISGSKYVPEVVYVQFYFNDIISSGVKYGIYYQGSGSISEFGKQFLKSSYLINNIYCFKKVRFEDNKPYIEYISDLVHNEKVWADHSQDIQAIHEFTKNHNAELRAIVFPYMKDFELSDFYTKSITEVLDSLRVPVINVDELIVDIPVKERVINSLDPHPSILVNRIVADRIIKDLKLKDQVSK